MSLGINACVFKFKNGIKNNAGMWRFVAAFKKSVKALGNERGRYHQVSDKKTNDCCVNGCSETEPRISRWL